jgi:hypothetical protein
MERWRDGVLEYWSGGVVELNKARRKAGHAPKKGLG